MGKASRNSKSLAPVVAAMSIAVSTGNETDSIDALLDSLQPGLVNETIETTETVTDAPSDGDLEAAVSTLETQEHYAAQQSEAEVKAAEKAAAKVIADAARAQAKADKAAAKAVEAANKAAIRAAKKADREAAKAAKPAPVPRVKYENKTDLMKSRLGDQLGEYMVLEVADAALEGAELQAKQNETLAVIDGLSQKPKNRANFLMTFMHKGGKLNEPIQRAFQVLKRDGQITTGDKGNYHLDLVSRPYAVSAARAMGNNTITVLRALKVILLGEKGVYAPNPDSLILAKVNQQLGL
jgi:hypothetical protein